MKNKIVGLNEKSSQMLKEFITEIKNESYAEGFEAGRKFDGVEETVSEFCPPLPQIIKTPNQQRAELIQRAKEFVEGKKNSFSGIITNELTGEESREDLENAVRFPISNRGSAICKVEFFNKRNRVSCLLKGFLTNKTYSVGRSNCNPTDVFNLYIGQAISLARALQIDIPVEFLKAVQPSEVVVGMVIELGGAHFTATEHTGKCRFSEKATIKGDTLAKYEVSTCRK